MDIGNRALPEQNRSRRCIPGILSAIPRIHSEHEMEVSFL